MIKKMILVAALAAVGCSNPSNNAGGGSTDVDMASVGIRYTDSTTTYRVPVDASLSIVTIDLLVDGVWESIDSYGSDDFDIGINETHDTMFIYNYTNSPITKIRTTERYRK
jgi:hypothetical protein